MKTKLSVLAIGALLFSFASPAFAVTCIDPELMMEERKAERYFAWANCYTVKVRTRVEYPFEDTRGSYSGAGFLINRKLGWIATNAHVSSRNPESLEIAFKGKKFIEASLHYVDYLLDFAILKVSPEKIPDWSIPAELACSGEPTVGSAVGAYGHPYSLSYSGTRGIVSGMRYRHGRRWVQTDAPINKGNSGGPLISLTNGKVIGINSATLSKRKSEGLGFAVPMYHACTLIRLLEREIDPSPSYIPISFAFDRDASVSDLYVAIVYRKQPVHWPLKVGDRVIALADDPEVEFENQGDLVHALRGKRNKVGLLIERSGKRETVFVHSKPRPKLITRVGLHVSGIVIGRQPLKDDELLNPDGLLTVYDVASASIGSQAGVASYNHLVSVDGRSFKHVDDLCGYLKKAEAKKEKVKMVTRIDKYEYRAQSKYGLHLMKPKNVKLVGPEAPENCGNGNMEADGEKEGAVISSVSLR